MTEEDNIKDLLPTGEGDEAALSGAADDDLSLPKATVYKLITEMLPPGVACPKETRDLLITCCVEFIHLLSSEANDVCEKNARKTISPEHVMDALRNLGFGGYVDEVAATYEEAVEQAKEKEKSRGTNKLEKSGLTEEELLKQQEELFEQARRKYLENQTRSAPESPNPALTELKE
jgi:histone H3/H4